jgi:hypothetical protein
MADRTTDIQFFGEIDRVGGTKTGTIKHSFPAWYFTNKLEELSFEINDLRNTIQDEGNLVGAHKDSIPELKRELASKESQMAQIVDSMPKLSPKDKDAIASVYGELGAQIRDSMFTYTDMQRGTASAHEEARRQKEACINVPHGATMLMQNMGINAKQGGKISRDEAAKAWKIFGRLLGEPTNVETLRKDFAGGSYKIHRSLDEMVSG